MKNTTMNQRAWGVRATVVAAALMLAGCATGPNANPNDPFEPYNRGMTTFNDKVDDVVLKPVATAYRDVTPSFVRTGVTNFFANLGDAWSFVNNLLQVKGLEAYESFVRFNVNTVFGLGGVLDIASEMDIDRHKQDFGLTLGHWGVPTGPYLVLPLLGPSTVRDTAALPVETYGNLLREVDPVSARNQLYALRIVDKRAGLLGAGSVLETASLDKYSFTRDAFLQYRSQQGASGRLQNDEDYDSGAGQLPREDE